MTKLGPKMLTLSLACSGCLLPLSLFFFCFFCVDTAFLISLRPLVVSIFSLRNILFLSFRVFLFLSIFSLVWMVLACARCAVVPGTLACHSLFAHPFAVTFFLFLGFCGRLFNTSSAFRPRIRNQQDGRTDGRTGGHRVYLCRWAEAYSFDAVRTAVPFLGITHLKIDWFVPRTGLQP